MANLSNYAEKKLCDHMLGLTSFTMPAVYLALFTADPGEAGSLTAEIGSGVGYTRVDVTAAMAPANATTGQALNEDVISVGPATADWGVITHAALIDSATLGAGNILMSAALNSSRNIQNGDVFQFAAAQLSVVFA
ncbi:hypothetical protein [Bosea sp. WAO]|uniref:phage tail fiber protein n=1 Tax=Bosea sp. WAO TaxID=406341 RepID=UPI00082E19D0|nr:hypothetical protein [Bosea sp. WAO]